MQNLRTVLFIWMLLSVTMSVCKALDCQLNESNQYKVAYTIFVDKSGHGNFTKIQSAIDSVPENNTQWIRIRISAGKYKEKVVIPLKKPCIFLEGSGSHHTSVEFDDHQDLPTSAIFISYSDNIVAKGITFKNTYNLQIREDKIIWIRAPAVRIRGDKTAFYHCAFFGIQDTFFDDKGRHYFKKCYIEGAMDFIYGAAQSIYDECVISLNVEKYRPGKLGCITAQKKEWAEEHSGFVFKNCKITGIGKACLGRAWGPYSTVIIYNSTITDVVVPQGWSAWDFVGHEANFTYVETNNRGRGADTANRVPWLQKLDDFQLSKFVTMSFIDEDGWIAKLPTVS